MSTEATPETPPLTTPSYSSDGGKDIVNDFVLWRRRKTLNTSIIVAATAAWVLMEVYQYNFLTLISWVAICFVASIFIYANMLRLLTKETSNLMKLELTEEAVHSMAKTVRARIEEAIRWLLMVSTKEDWPVFLGVMAVLSTLSYVGSCMDFLTFIYIGILAGMTVPVTYMKNEDKIRRMMEWVREKYKTCYEIIDEKAINKTKSIYNRQLQGKGKEV